MNLVKLPTTTEPNGDHDPEEQKLNFLISSFTRELFNFTVWQNDHAANKVRKSKVSVSCVGRLLENERKGTGVNCYLVWYVVYVMWQCSAKASYCMPLILGTSKNLPFKWVILTHIKISNCYNFKRKFIKDQSKAA